MNTHTHTHVRQGRAYKRSRLTLQVAVTCVVSCALRSTGLHRKIVQLKSINTRALQYLLSTHQHTFMKFVRSVDSTLTQNPSM